MKEPFEPVPPVRPGDRVIRRRRPRRRLRIAPNIPGVLGVIWDIIARTPFLPILSILVVLLLLFSAGLYFTEAGVNESLDSYGDAVWWGLAAMQTMGSGADQPVTDAGTIIFGIWAVLGTMLFFGAVIASVTAYFQLPRRRPTRQIITTIQYNLERMEDLSKEELETLRDAATNIIEAQIERVEEKHT